MSHQPRSTLLMLGSSSTTLHHHSELRAAEGVDSVGLTVLLVEEEEVLRASEVI